MIGNPIELAHQVGSLLNQLGIPYYVGGSVASSLHGESRYTEDLDLVISIEQWQVKALIANLSPSFYISDVAIDDAVSGRTSSFNIIHLENIEKVDIFVLGHDAFSQSVMSRIQTYDIGEGRAINVCSPDSVAWRGSAIDIVLQKLVWFKMAASESQKQWRDILGVLKLQGDKLDMNYMLYWASHLRLTQEMTRAESQAARR